MPPNGSTSAEEPVKSTRFLALTGAPTLRPGVILNVMATPQVEGVVPPGLRCGEVVEIRFGYCCPQMAKGTVAALADDHLILVLADTRWTLKPGPIGGGVEAPGIVSSDWIVC